MKPNWIRKIIGGISVTSALFVFQACYGTPQDLGLDVFVRGVVKSKPDGTPINGIKVSDVNQQQYDYTNENGEFLFYLSKADSILLRFADIDSTRNNSYLSKDTLLTGIEGEIYLEIELESAE